MKKILHVLASFVLIFSMFGGLLVPTASAVDYTGDPYVTDVQMMTTNGATIENGGTLVVDTKYKLQYEWEIPDNTYKKGDKLNFSIPKEFQIVDQFTFNLESDGQRVAVANVLGTTNSGYYIQMEFTTDYISTHSNVSGTFLLTYQLNRNFVKAGDTVISFPPDFDFIVNIPDFNTGGGGGGSGVGSGNPSTNRKAVEYATENLRNPETGQLDMPTKLMKWNIALGKKTMLGKAQSFDEIKSITVEDEPVDQEIIPYSDFTTWKNKVGYEKAFFDKSSWHYSPIDGDVMGVEKHPVGGYYYKFKMDILPTVKKLQKEAQEKDPEDDLREYNIEYYTLPLDDIFEEREYENKAKITITYNDGKSENWFLYKKFEWSMGSGTITGNVASVEMTKVDKNSGNGLEGAKFDLYKWSRSGEFTLYKEGIVSDKGGKVRVDKLTTGDYQFREVTAPTGYQLVKAPLDFEIRTEDLGTNKVINLGKFENRSDTTKVSVKKVWEDNGNSDGKRPNIIEVQLYANGKAKGDPEILAEGDKWSHEWTDLPKYEDGKEIVYTVAEVTSLQNGYKSTQEKNKDGFDIVITNTRAHETVDVSGKKSWDHGNNTNTPTSVEVQLYANGEKVDGKTQTTNAANNWEYTFKNLPKYEKGEIIKYTVVEKSDFDDYTTTYDGTNIKNTYSPKTTSITVIKDWDHGNNPVANQPKSLNVTLHANGQPTSETATLNASNNWQYTFTDLAILDDNGKEIKYTVVEDPVKNYSLTATEEVGDVIYLNNDYEDELVSVKGEKTWADANNQDGKRPPYIEINLFADGKQIDQLKVTGDATTGKWAYEFKDLLKYNSSGKEVVYTVTEEPIDVDGYETTQNGSNFTNSYTPEKTSVKGKKVWQDQNNQDGKRPDKITVKLFADGKDTNKRQVLATDKNEVAFEFKDLDKYQNGKEIVYTVDEIEVDGYTTSIAQSDFTIYNSYTPETTEIEGEKIWKDDDDRDGYRSDSVQIDLYANDERVAHRIASEETNWKYRFENLPKYEDGKLIKYRVEEGTKLPHYTTTIDGYTITNTHPIEKIDIKGKKEWVDGENQDNIRPDSITVRLLADGKEVQVQQVTTKDPSDEKTAWAYEFIDLPKYRDGGIEIKYTVVEDPVDGYGTTIDEFFTIVNTHKPAEVEIEGEKTWDDADNQDGKRPKKIIVNLLADGKQVDEKIVTEEDNWAYKFTNLPKYKKGDEIEYKIAEELIEGYSTTYEGDANQHITNSYTPSKTARTVMKFWEDIDDQDGKRPGEIQVQLYANGEELREPIVLNEENDWDNTWEDLDEMKAGKPIVYTAKEIGVPDGYEVTLDDETSPGTFILVNTYTPEVVEVNGQKTWDDADDQDGKRPGEITVHLLANGEQVASQTVTEKDDWAYEFTDLPKFRNGVEIVYKVTEDSVKDYTTEIDGSNITNHYTPGKTSVTVTKEWDDENDRYGKRPASIFVQLYADGKVVGEKEKLNKANNWTKTWSDLDEMNNGKKIVYTVKETTKLDDYEVSINNGNIGNIIVTNKYVGDICIPGKPGNPNDPEKPNDPNVPEDPDGCEPEKPGNPEKPGDPNVPENPDQCDPPNSNDPSGKNPNECDELPTSNNPSNNGGGTVGKNPDQGNTNNTGKLPQTGTSMPIWYIVAGVLLLIGGFFLLRMRNKKRKIS